MYPVTKRRDKKWPCRPKYWQREERWKPVKGYNNLYEISNTGKVKSKPVVRKGPNRLRHTVKLHLLKVRMRDGTPSVHLTNMDKTDKWLSLPELVADHFMRPRLGLPVVFKDPRFKNDCSIWNLKENVVRVSKRNKLTIHEVVEIRKKFKASENERGIQVKLAKEYKVDRRTINAIVRRTKWTVESNPKLLKLKPILQKLEPELYE